MIEDILHKKLTKQQLTRAEKQMLERWLSTDIKNRKTFNQMKLVFWEKQGTPAEQLKEHAWSDIMHRIGDTEASQKKRIFHFSRFGPWARVAAILLLVFATGGFFYHVTSVDGHDERVAEMKWIEKVSMAGQKVIISLPDGTRVKLNAGSKLLAPEKFVENTREVTLTGEAFFEVAENQERPFIVHTDHLDIKVLGTSFNVKAYDTEEKIKVAVATGKVAVSNPGATQDDVLLTPGKIAAYTSASERFDIGEFDWDVELGWKDNNLVFEKNNLSEIFQTLARWYGVEFEMQRALNNNRDYSGTYYNPTLQSVLEGLSFVYHFKYEINETTVVIK